jgi:gliding motility-associated-like protein
VEVIIEEPTPVPLELATCEGTTIEYEGVSLSVGDNMEFTLQDVLGCDSIVAVSVVGLADSASELSLETCENTTIDYEGVTLDIGDNVDFTFQNYLGCDSIVNVSVLALANDTTELSLETCANTYIVYQDTELNAGETQTFTFQNIQGCDSIVTVNGQALQNETLTFEACEGESVEYNGTWLEFGESSDFLFTDQNGCDSTVSVSVIALAISEESLVLETCVGETVNYQDTLLNVGDEAIFTFENYLGCDSIVYVSVEAGGDREDFGIPNVFTPNGDGMNDCFGLVNLNDMAFATFDLQIFDRWGKLIFSTSNPADCWNGEINGGVATADVYVYVLEAETQDCDLEISEIGDLTLVR